jgi:hypothetical protein
VFVFLLGDGLERRPRSIVWFVVGPRAERLPRGVFGVGSHLEDALAFDPGARQCDEELARPEPIELRSLRRLHRLAKRVAVHVGKRGRPGFNVSGRTV